MKKMLIAALILPVALLGAARPTEPAATPRRPCSPAWPVGVGAAVILDALMPRPVVAGPAPVVYQPAPPPVVYQPAPPPVVYQPVPVIYWTPPPVIADAPAGGLPDAAGRRVSARPRDREGSAPRRLRAPSGAPRVRPRPARPTDTGRSDTSPTARCRRVVPVSLTAGGPEPPRRRVSAPRPRGALCPPRSRASPDGVHRADSATARRSIRTLRAPATLGIAHSASGENSGFGHDCGRRGSFP